MKLSLALLGAAILASISSGKPLPHGIYWLGKGYSSQSLADATTWGAWTNPHICGVVARQSWESLEPCRGQFNFAFLDSVAQLCANNHKQWELVIECGMRDNFALYPKWLSCAKVTLHDNSGNPCTIPVPWDYAFQDDLRGMVDAIGARYDGRGWLRIVQMEGIGREGELYFCSHNPSYSSDVYWLMGHGGPAAYIRAAEEIAAFYESAFPHTPCIYSEAAPLPRSVDPYNDTMRQIVCDLSDSYGSKFGLRDSAYFLGSARPQWSRTFMGYQQLHPSRDAGLEADQIIYSPYFGQWFEVYARDCEPPDNWDSFEAFNQATHP